MGSKSDFPRVAVTGVGILCGLGIGREEVWANAAAGASGARTITRFDAGEHNVKIACEVPDFDPDRFVDTRSARRADPVSILAVAAGRLALEDADLDAGALTPERSGAVVASGTGGNMIRERQYKVMRERGPDRISPFAVPHSIANTPSALVSITFGLRGPVFSTTNACAASTDAVGTGGEIIRRGDADLVLAGGADSMVTPFWIAAFDAMRVLSHHNEDPAGAARPFDRSRDGFLIGEAGAVIVLERMDRALERGARIICELAGYGNSADAYHITDPDPTGEPQSWAMEAAIKDAAVAAEEVDYVNAHGGASQPGDPAEVLAIQRALGTEAAAAVAVSATKSMHGHCMGAAGAVEAALTAMAIEHQVLPPTLNLTDLDPDCEGVDHVVDTGRPSDVRVALSASYGLGGHNAVICMTRPAEAA
ncbi:MAG: beta-ketoacyl-ACP synthase II [Thermoleophilia bacterium]|nr:beta-ketoacyl-ACP synthase II [Thermoleophilia bacterium]